MVLFEPMIRFDSAGLTLAVLVLATVCVALIGAMPVVALRNRRIGRIQAEPKLTEQVARLHGELAAARKEVATAERREADMAEKWAVLAAWASRGPDLAAAPTDRQRHLALVGKR